jgi:hypothetical protein
MTFAATKGTPFSVTPTVKPATRRMLLFVGHGGWIAAIGPAGSGVEEPHETCDPSQV